MASAQQVAVTNDMCKMATNISSLPYTAILNISTATSDGQNCDGTQKGDIGVWYTYKSDRDAAVEVFIDDSRSYNDANFAAFEGSCDNLICLKRIANVRQGLWVAYAGVEYHLLVSRRYALKDRFVLKISVSGTKYDINNLTCYCRIHTFYFTRMLKDHLTRIANQRTW